ncbi:TPA: bifunctional phosphopantothenoylcysteine decarboxylase/phosphopantothenate--cysteine ligase CoaBC [Stenotrophomonas maltophilia]|uniref:bifunctional phosphopantothenoylcysteine decarboxylase/phosphopantothenate--cysteine ligase CoaBC n=1 Tax=Stenotrophomonas sp. TaxID=69392 RepID=UPI0028B246F6|nr:bifunctional phosphopantothenoylcysteine decarboxylase/phosphopantothenate--cysteine ligase CoaBC [Stenotrophomonas sp.]HDS1040161.1 bifunctional phosphopantothenoylcysteine decarboxylase/phosphopantothenate--cysteine ligase CoaBC [Stenotrophomonas maltophilia]HDS1044306.1 bifunctional phosphopantothenoylcysteine decarboxylase/phosphopantothenate--cysteine ligase CoaBC [Stenotrophomonas maltophilia]
MADSPNASPAPNRALEGQKLLLCVGGGIAAYKALELVRRLRDAGALVQVAMTAGAQQFVTPLSFQALSGQPTRTTLWDSAAEQAMGHIELARWADRIVVAPGTADLLARLAQGHADDLVSTLCLASTAPLTVCPAMNHRMWLHPATQANIALLRQRGAQVIGPVDGPLAEGESGPGRLAEPTDIVAALAGNAAPPTASAAAPETRALQGLRLLISAGPTYEDIDPVRYVGNRSSGKMGFALAAAAAAMGAQVVLVSGPVQLPTPAGVQRVDVRSAAQMRDAVLKALPADIYIGAAAVSDYTPRQVAAQKLKKTADSQSLVIELVRTPDILAEVAAQTQSLKLVVGFAAETHDVEKYARGKLVDKRLDLVIANQVGISGGGFESDNNAATAFWQDGEQVFPATSKRELAEQLLALIARRLQA